MTIDFKKLNETWGKYGTLEPFSKITTKKKRKYRLIPKQISRVIANEKSQMIDSYYKLSRNELITQLLLRDKELGKFEWHIEDMKKTFEKYYANAEFEIKELQNKLKKYELKRTTGPKRTF